jgi:hypothetical protein
MMLPIGRALLIAAWSGFLALSYEVLWARFYSFASQSRTPAFGALLGSYLLGLSLGAIMARFWQLNAVGEVARTRHAIAIFLLGSSLLSFSVIPTAAWLVQFPSFASYPLRTLPLIAAASALLGTVLPFICSVAVAADRESGARIASIYIANIVGSGAGSLITGFVLMDIIPLGEISTLLLGLSIFVSAAIAWSPSRFLFPFLLLSSWQPSAPSVDREYITTYTSDYSIVPLFDPACTLNTLWRPARGLLPSIPTALSLAEASSTALSIRASVPAAA